MDNYSYVSKATFLAAELLMLTPSLYSDTSTNEQKKDWFLRLNPNGN